MPSFNSNSLSGRWFGRSPETSWANSGSVTCFGARDNKRLILEWEGAYKPAEPEAVNFKVPPGGYEPYRTNEYPHDFNMNHMADWFKAIKDVGLTCRQSTSRSATAPRLCAI